MSPPFRRIGLFGKTGDDRARRVLVRLAGALTARGLAVRAERATAADAGLELPSAPLDALVDDLDLLLVVGGDGTLLAAARAAARSAVPVAGLNAGRLGFLADLAPDALDARLEALLSGRGTAETRALLAARLHRAAGGVEDLGIALNDAVLQKRDSGRMIEFTTHVDGRFVGAHRADGMVIATPTGSTAYALSCGGPILYPSLDALAIVPICPHTLSDRPIVVGGGARISLTLAASAAGGAQVMLDGQLGSEAVAGDRVEVTRAASHLTLLHPPDHDHFEVLRTKLRWGRGEQTTDR
jgi:NAD+ kinase